MIEVLNYLKIMDKSEILELLRKEQQERRIELIKSLEYCGSVPFITISEDIRWWNKYIRHIEDNY